MQPRLLKQNQVEYVQAPWDGENRSGYQPVGDRILILPDKASEQTSGGIFIDDHMVERLNLSASSGRLIALGDDAFAWNSDRTRPFAGTKPKAGDHIFFEKFAGLVMTGKDGVQYRLADDKAVGSVEIH